MANILSKSGITDNSTIRTWHVTQSIDAFTNVEAYDITISGSLTIIGDLNLDTNPTGNLIGNSAYSLSSSYSQRSLSSSYSTYAKISNDITAFQLYHGEFKYPAQNKTYYFAIDIAPITTLTTSSDSVGTFIPTNLTIISASLTTTITGTTGSNEASSYSLYKGNTLIHDFEAALSHNAWVSYSLQEINAVVSASNRPIYMVWKTPATWTTAPTFVSHNLVLYCTRGYNPV
jgi:hypothetical protein